MNKSIKLNNFRGFQDQNFDLSRVNIFIGENSSGKSSFLKFLLSLKQTIEEPEISNLILNGNLVDLGNYKETIHFHDEEKVINFNFSFKNELLDFYKYFFDEDPEKINIIEPYIDYDTFVDFEINRELSSHKEIKTVFVNEKLGKLSIFINEDKNEAHLGEQPKCNIVFNKTISNEIFVLENIGYEAKGFLSIINSEDVKMRIKEKEISNDIFYEIALFLINQNLLEIYLKNLSYLNPLDSKPQRIYFKKDAQSKYKENNLDKFANIVTNNSIDKKTLKDFSKVLANFGIVDDLKFSISKNFPVAEIKVQIKDLISNIYDVGYGVSLQIPLLFETFLSEKAYGNTFLIEQPEVHLHPRLQAKFIDTLLGMGKNNSYVIETHSEHIVRMLQVLVKEKKHKIKPDDVKIYYFTRDSKEFKIETFSILENGHLDKVFPSGFFDNSYNLTKSLMF